ncbi:MAG: MBL fold metallo-hydrolase [Myxococcota bacterium]
MAEPDEINELGPGLWRLPLRTPTLPPATRTNTYVLGQRQLCVVDPAPVDAEEQEQLLEFLKARRREGAHLAALVLTHHHGDHVGATTVLHERLGIPVAAHAETAARVKVPVALVLKDGDHLPCDGPSWTAIFTPGHAAGHLCFLRSSDRTLIAGDMVAGVGTILVDPDEGSMSQYMASLRRLLALHPRTLLPAHGHALPDGVAHLNEYIHHRNARAEAVLERLHAGDETPTQMVPHIYVGVPVFMYPLAARSVMSILLQHVEEGRARRVGEDSFRPL